MVNFILRKISIFNIPNKMHNLRMAAKEIGNIRISSI